jgi:hypothetical protein
LVRCQFLLAFSPYRRAILALEWNKDGAMAINANANDGDSGAPEPLLTEQQTADLNFGGSLYLLREARKDGSGPPWVRIGRKYFYPPQGVAEHQRALKQFRSKAEYYNENPAAADFAERARGAMTYARKTRWTSQAKSKHRRSCAARVL